VPLLDLAFLEFDVLLHDRIVEFRRILIEAGLAIGNYLCDGGEAVK